MQKLPIRSSSYSKFMQQRLQISVYRRISEGKQQHSDFISNEHEDVTDSETTLESYSVIRLFV